MSTSPVLAQSPTLEIDGAVVRTGSCSWADRSLTQESDWYPRRTMKAAERIAYYASRFSVVEVDSTFRFPPTPDLSRQWVERTPPGFVMDIKAWSLLSGFAAFPDSLWPDLTDEINPQFRDRPKLYLKHLSNAAVEECWNRFVHSLKPLHHAGRLGAVIVEYPPWFSPREGSHEILVKARKHLGSYRMAVQFNHERWLASDHCESTLSFLEDHDIAFVCSDWINIETPVVASTTDLAIVKFFGSPDEWGHRYTKPQLDKWVSRIHDLAESSDEVHLLMATSYRDAAVRNAENLGALLDESHICLT